MKFRTGPTALWQPGWMMANVWLTFLVFPIISVLLDAGLSIRARIGGLILIGVFAVIHALGYRVLIRREMGLVARPTSVGVRRLFDPERSELWFGLLVLTLAIGWLVAGWGMLGAMPFIVTFAIFNFSWRVAGVAMALCLVVSVVGPLTAGILDEFWFLSMIVVAAAFGAAIARYGEERQHDVNALNTQLLLTEERERVARDVHDVLGHSLTAVVLKAQVTERLLVDADESSEVVAAREQLAEIQDVSRKALAEIRATVSGLRSVALGDELSAARSVLSDAEVDLFVHGDPATVPPRHQTAVGMTVREAVTNIVRHADASRCSIELGTVDRLLVVSDDGVGLGQSREGNGLTGLRERLAADGLELQVEHDEGTTLVVTSTEVPA